MTDLSFDALREQALACRRCGLCEGRKQVVFGAGNPKAAVMLVGEGPGEQEDIQGEPFVGRSGQLMDQMLEYIGLTRERNIYIANMVKCRPPHNRDPLPEEMDCCMEWLRGQISCIRPRIIVCVGRISACRLMSPDFKVTRQHGEFIQKGDFLMMGTFHPAAILRNINNKPAAFQDMLLLRDKIMELGIEL